MSLFVLADLHLSFSADKPMDVFGGSWHNYIDRIWEYWNYMVNENDTVVVPGDISWAMELSEAKADFDFIEKLNGKKILMKGNHDYWWNTISKLERFIADNSYQTISFLHNNAYIYENKILCGTRGWMCEDKMTSHDMKILSREAQRLQISIDYGKALAEKEKIEDPEFIVFSHYPIVTASQIKNPILDILIENNIKRVYYGHLHNWGTKPLYDELCGIKFHLVSSDYRVFTPMKID